MARKDNAMSPPRKRRPAAQEPAAPRRPNEPLPEERPGPLPERFTPQLATPASAVPPGDEWLHEIKFDGYRIIARIAAGVVTLTSRNDKDWTRQLPTIVRAVRALPASTALLDGEVVILDERGASDFQALQNAIGSRAEETAHYYVFDLLHLDGRDLTRVPLIDRKAILARLVNGGRGALKYSDHVVGNGPEFLAGARRLGLEGVISKRHGQPYRPGRTTDWLKVKCGLEQEFVIIGWTEPERGRTGFGALLLGVHDQEGSLLPVGKVGTGFSEKSLADLRSRLEKIEMPSSPAAGRRGASAPRGVHWTQPVLVAQVKFAGWTGDGNLRHPSFAGLREDKDPKTVRRETPPATASSAAPDPPPARGASDSERKRAARPATAKRGVERALELGGVQFTNPGRVYYPEGLTKEDLARHYLLVAERILPHLLDRPLTLVRCPQGISKPCFYQKHAHISVPPAVKRIPIVEKEERGEYLMVDSLPGLLSLVQAGALELHVWGSRFTTLESPDRLVFDLDPDPQAPWPWMVEAARLLRARLSALGLESFLQTTGGKGLHVVAPLVPGDDWGVVREFARAFAARIAAEAPERYLIVATKALRRGKIFIDYLRNGRGATAITPYSTRARPRAPVAVPVRWDELGPDLRPDAYTVENLPRRLRSLKEDPWEGYSHLRQRLHARAKKDLGL
jgi:bifunctional non-homologous end joining protein LigD